MTDVRLAFATTWARWAERPHRDETVERQREAVPGLLVVEDEWRQGSWPVVRAAYLRLLDERPDATHHVVLHDDMLPCRDFVRHLQGAVAAMPDEVVTTFSMRRVIREAWERGHRWVRTAGLVWGGCSAHPAGWSLPYVEWAEAQVSPSLPSADARFTYWLQYVHGTGRSWLTVPSLTEHLEPGESLLGHGNGRRVATLFADEVGAPPDWSVPYRPLTSGSRVPVDYLGEHLRVPRT